MMIDYYRQNEMRTKNCYKNCVTLSLRYDYFVINLMIV